MKKLESKARELRSSIVEKFGSLRAFSLLIEVEEIELLSKLTIELTDDSYKGIYNLYKNTNIASKSGDIITDALRSILREKILLHEDAKNEKSRTSYQEFFIKNPTWTNTYFSEVMNGKRAKITNKLHLLCIKLDIEFKSYI